MAMVEVDTLTDSCWEKCEDFDVDVTNYFSHDAAWHKAIRCRNVDKCRRIQQVIDEELKRGDNNADRIR